MAEERFWKKSWDEGISDLDPQSWEISYVDAVRPAFENYPDTAALVFMDVKITFAELDRFSNRFANMLIQQGIGKGDVVGINLPNIPEYVIGWLGALKAGCVVSGVSPLLAAEEMHNQLEDCGASALVTLDAAFAGRVEKIAAELPELKLVIACSVGGFLPLLKKTAGRLSGKIPKGRVTPITGKRVLTIEEIIKTRNYPDGHPEIEITPDDIAYIQYTGGTTGPPKGAMLTHRNVMADLLIVQSWLGWERGSGSALSGFPFFHIAGMFFNKNCIYLGWTQILIPDPRNTDHICDQLAKYKPGALVNVPSLFQLLIANPKFARLDHSHLYICVSAASPFPEESQKALEAVVGRGKLVEAYGMTETSPLTVANPYRGKKKLGSIGLPLPNTDIKLIDPGTGRKTAPGEAGEICIKGPQVMAGYLNRPEETQKAIDKDGYMHTGDVGVFDEEGYLRIVDRTKDMVIVSGFKVFSRKVEDVLSRHPAIDMVAIIGTQNPERPGSELVRAYVTLSQQYAETQDKEAVKKEILDFAKEKLTAYEVPREIEFRGQLPLTAVGKIDKKQLRKETS